MLRLDLPPRQLYGTDPNGAILSLDGKYRYILWRGVNWSENKTIALFIMLNPSTADASQDDATIRRCRGFAQDLGFNGFLVVNLFAYRTPSPAEVFNAHLPDPIGPECDAWIDYVRHLNVWPIFAWGAHPKAAQRAKEISQLFLHTTRECLGVTKDGHPRHPLYVRRGTPLQWYPPDQFRPNYVEIP
jgi:hypothetical protein